MFSTDFKKFFHSRSTTLLLFLSKCSQKSIPEISKALFFVLFFWLLVLFLCCYLKTYSLLVHKANIHLFPLLTSGIAIQCLLFRFFVEVSRCQSSLVVAANNKFSSSVRAFPLLFTKHEVLDIKGTSAGILAHHYCILFVWHYFTPLSFYSLYSWKHKDERGKFSPVVMPSTDSKGKL